MSRRPIKITTIQQAEKSIAIDFDEHWRPVEGWPYYVSDDGRVARGAPEANTYVGKVLRPSYSHAVNGHYLYYVLCRNGKTGTFKAHTLVALAFVGPKPGARYQIRHLDGNPTNNHYSNLAWGTAKENAADTLAHGRQLSGEKCARAVLTNEEVRQIRTEHQAHLTGRQAQGNIRSKRGFVTALAAKWRVNIHTLRAILCVRGYNT